MRLAIEEGASLVPVVVLGEVDCLRNFINLPRLQVSATLERLHSPHLAGARSAQDCGVIFLPCPVPCRMRCCKLMTVSLLG